MFWGLLVVGLIGCMPPYLGARAFLYPHRRHVEQLPGRAFEDVQIKSDGVILKGWLFRSESPSRGTIIYLHGSSENRVSGLSIVDYYQPKGFDVLIYDSRAHGESTGEFCTYGYYEKQDLKRIIDSVSNHPIILGGVSLGAAVSLQSAAEDNRIKSVISIATFADLKSLTEERSPFFVSRKNMEDIINIAEKWAQFKVDDVSPLLAAPNIQASVLLIHGEKDSEISVAHSRKVYDALIGMKRLIIVPNAGHNDAITPSVWKEIDLWIESVVESEGKTSRQIEAGLDY